MVCGAVHWASFRLFSDFWSSSPTACFFLYPISFNHFSRRACRHQTSTKRLWWVLAMLQSRISLWRKLQQGFFQTWLAYFQTISELKKSSPKRFWRENWWYQGLRNGSSIGRYLHLDRSLHNLFYDSLPHLLSRWKDLNQYKLLIIQTARRFSDKSWLHYHIAFRKEAVTASWKLDRKDQTSLCLKIASGGRSNSIVFQNSIWYINHSFSIPLQCPNYFINSADKTKFLHFTP